MMREFLGLIVLDFCGGARAGCGCSEKEKSKTIKRKMPLLVSERR